MDPIYATPSTTSTSSMSHATLATYLFHLILYPIQCFNTRSLLSILAFIFILSSLIFTKPRVDMMDT
jgi:hypothetical protein